MTTLRILGVAALAVMMSAPDAMAQRGGAVRGGMRGAVVGGMVGGEIRSANRRESWRGYRRNQGRRSKGGKPQCHECGDPGTGPVPNHGGISER